MRRFESSLDAARIQAESCAERFEVRIPRNAETARLRQFLQRPA